MPETHSPSLTPLVRTYSSTLLTTSSMLLAPTRGRFRLSPYESGCAWLSIQPGVTLYPGGTLMTLMPVLPPGALSLAARSPYSRRTCARLPTSLTRLSATTTHSAAPSPPAGGTV